MSERELKRYIEMLNNYAAKVKATETKEQSRYELIKAGILDEDGNVAEEYASIIK